MSQPSFPCAARAAAWSLAVAAVHAAATSAAGAQQATTGTVAGRVTGENGEPLAGVGISVTGTTNGTLTRGDGAYRVTLRPGRYELRARLIGYGLARDTVTVAAGAAVTRNFRLTRTASTLEAVAVVGSRTQPRTAVESPVPVDVLGAAEIRSTGRTETAQILQQLAPSVNFPRATISDGTDVVRPATLRGLGADQVLVLINGRRRHTSALINVNGSIGRGQAAVDLNAIPSNMIERIEVLRDGASAQYGSDAIAGVINIVLKGTAPGEGSLQMGGNVTTYGTTYGPGRTARDGRTVRAALDGGRATSATRFFHVGGEYRDRGYTNRTLGDPRPQSFTEVATNVVRTNATGPINHRQGDAATRDATLFFNSGTELAGGTQLYAFGGFGGRRGESAGFFRRRQDDRTVRAINPNGFLPLIRSRILDLSTFAGARGTAGGVGWELSTGVGGNSFNFNVANSNNAALGAASPRTFDAGTLVFQQYTTNLDLTRELRAGAGAVPVRLAAGAEFRADRFQVKAGDPASYAANETFVLDSLGNPTTRLAAPGAQVFPGFTPGDAGARGRSATSVYAEAESDLTPRWLVDGAVRYEYFSDFGSTTNAKFATRVKATDAIVFRGAASTGFRAPSLQQSFYSATATNFINGVPFDVKTAPVASPIAKLLGATPLKPEKSVNFSGGVALQPARSVALTVDYYNIFIRDRVVLSENFTGPQVAALLAPFKATGARYFTNAINTRTQGVDVVANSAFSLGTAGSLRLTAGYNHNYTRATRVSTTPPALGNQNETLFGRVERGRLELGQPRSNVLASADYAYRAFGAVARVQRFGSVVSRGTLGNEALDQRFGAKAITDVSLSYRVRGRATLAVGADNLLDVYPDQNNNNGNARTGAAGNANFGIFPYNQFSPFGFNGRFVYTRLTIGL